MAWRGHGPTSRGVFGVEPNFSGAKMACQLSEIYFGIFYLYTSQQGNLDGFGKAGIGIPRDANFKQMVRDANIFLNNGKAAKKAK